MKLRIEDVLATAELPSLPEVAHRVLALARDASTNVDALAETVKADPAMSAKILRTANSAFFGRQFKVRSVRAAIPILGATLIRTLVLGFSLTHKATWHFLEDAYRRIWRRGLIQAVAAEMLAKRLPGEDSEAFFVAGLIQDIGVLAILRTSPREYIDVVIDQSSILNQFAVERHQLGFTHVDVSVALCKTWDLDETTIDAIRDHHAPLVLLRNAPDYSPLKQALKLATHYTDAVERGEWEPTREFQLAMSRSFGIKPEELQRFSQETQVRLHEAANVFSVDIGKLPSKAELLSGAKVAIEDIAIQSQIEAARAKKDAIIVRNKLESLEDWKRQIEQEMYKDPLTGAYNRRLLETGMQPEIDRCISEQQSLAILFLDIDNFKPINDICGHEAGDEALKMVVRILRGSLRSQDLIIRYGGDEFLVVFQGLEMEALEEIAERICDRTRDQLLRITDRVFASISVGGILCPVESVANVDISSLIRKVDEKMYKAKKNGGNQFVIDPLQESLSTSS